jgi:RNA polymerase sigma-70 factor (ECF subfamily)
MKNVEIAWLKYRQNLFLFIRKHVQNEQDTEDIVNDVFEKLLKQCKNNAIPSNISAWLYHVSKNSMIDYYRKRKLTEELPYNLSTEIEETSVIQEISRCLIPMIKQLPENYKEAVFLSEIDEKKHKVVASELGISLSAAKSRVLRGKKQLYQLLIDCCVFSKNEFGNTVSFERKDEKPCSFCK